jgi:hypothetical protein
MGVNPAMTATRTQKAITRIGIQRITVFFPMPTAQMASEARGTIKAAFLFAGVSGT